MTSGNGSGGSFIIHSPGARSGFGPRATPAPVQPPDTMLYELDALRRQIEAIKEEPLLVATIVEMRGERMMISLGPGGTLDVHAIEGAAVGRRVRCNRNTMQAIDLLPEETPTGTILTSLRDTLPGELVEAEVLGTVRGFKSSRAVRKGERVIVDPGLTFAIGSLGMPPARYAYARETNVSWSDVGGQAEAKAAIHESIEIPFAYPELFAAYGKRLPKGLMLHGPSGTGKTLIAMALATMIAKLFGKNAKGGFISVKGPELLASYIGKTEEAIRLIFSAAREYRREHGVPAVIFFDECDALMSRRDKNEHTSLNATVVPQLLAEMDGLDDAAAIVVIATNRPDVLDPAIVRDGRIDYRVKVGRPSQDDARAIARIHLAERPLEGMTRDEAAAAIADGIFAHDAEIASYTSPNRPETITLRLRHFVTGAMIQRAIEAAATSAMLRDIEIAEQKATSRGPRASGITREDIERALDRAAASVEHTTHTEALSELSSTP